MAKSSCAACEMPILRGQEVTTASTEVFHRGCIAFMSESVRTRLERELSAVRAQAQRAQLAAEHAKENAQRLARDSQEDAHERNRLRLEIAQMQTSLHLATMAREEAQANADGRQAALRTANARIAELERALAARPTTTPEPVQEAKSGRDDTEIRFSLLELDNA